MDLILNNMSSPTRRKPSCASSLFSRSSESVDFGGNEENFHGSDRIVHKSSGNCDFWEKEEQDFQGLNPQIDHSECFSNFISELRANLNISLPSDSIQSVSRVLQNSLQNFITCSILDLKKSIEDLYKAIQNFEDYGETNAKLYLGSFVFTLNIFEKDLIPGTKIEIGKNFASFFQTHKELEKLPEFLSHFTKSLESEMSKSYSDSISHSSIKPITTSVLYKNHNYLSDLENFQLRKDSLQTFNMKKEIEWDRHELKFMKGQLKSKLQEIKIREKDLKIESSKISEGRIKVAKDNQKMEKILEDLEDRKIRFLKMQENLKNIVNEKPRLSECNLNSSFMSNSSIASMDVGESLEEEQKILEKELDELKLGLSQSGPEVQDSLSMKINKIQNRLTTIRSEKMLSMTNKRSHKMNTVISKLQKTMSIKQNPLPRMPLSSSHKSIIPSIPFTQTLSGRRSTFTPIPFQISTHHTRSPTYTPPNPLTPLGANRSNNTTPINERVELHTHKKSEGFFPSDFRHSLETEEKDEYQEQKLRSLVLKEARLLQKEEEILKKENWVKSNMDRSINDKDVLETIRAERMNINRKLKEYEAKEKRLEDKYMELEKLESKVFNRNKDIERQQVDFELEKGRFEQEKDEWYQKLDDIQRVLADSL